MSDLRVTDLGESGPQVVFCHGLFGQGKNWTQIGRELSADHRVRLVDLPNHGASPWHERVDLVRDADLVAEVLEPGPTTLVGHSMGGKIAMLAALRHPEAVERLCVVDVSPVPYDSTDEFAGYIEAMRGMDLASIQTRGDADEALADAVRSRMVRGFLLQNLRRAEGSWRWRLNLEALGNDLDRVSGWPEESLDGVAPYDGPVLWLAGARSGYVSDDYAPEMERLFPKVRRVTIKDAGHWVHSEQPEVFLQVLRHFLAAESD